MGINAFAIHGHFYQPPREDPLTGAIPTEPGAAPYSNWNERIHDHCYRPNALLGNYERISFNFGPTLMDWMADFAPRTVEKIVEQNRWNLEKNGIGNALAQAYNHTIMPLASRVDKITQVRWGIADFLHRFGHRPKGMWLPETGVDEETLAILSDHGIEFTILAPWQADTNDFNVNHPYLVDLSEGKKISVFFYDQDLSTRISFDPGATVNADTFLNQFLLPKYDQNSNDQPQLVLVASDGELYGHHQPFRDKFLAYLMGGALSKYPIDATYPGLWLREHPAEEKIKIRSATSWSCHHGVLRWSGACACTPHAEWKAPLRQAMNEIAGMVDVVYLNAIREVILDPWELRHQFIHVLLGDTNLDDLLDNHLVHAIDETERRKIWLLLSAQYERQRIFTSCGWFFEDFDRIEPRNNVAYAAQSVWLSYLATGVDLSPKAAACLRPIKSWRTGARADAIFNHHLNRARTSPLIGTI